MKIGTLCSTEELIYILSIFLCWEFIVRDQTRSSRCRCCICPKYNCNTPLQKRENVTKRKWIDIFSLKVLQQVTNFFSLGIIKKLLFFFEISCSLCWFYKFFHIHKTAILSLLFIQIFQRYKLNDFKYNWCDVLLSTICFYVVSKTKLNLDLNFLNNTTCIHVFTWHM